LQPRGFEELVDSCCEVSWDRIAGRDCDQAGRQVFAKAGGGVVSGGLGADVVGGDGELELGVSDHFRACL
jgi:hypothetical protein